MQTMSDVHDKSIFHCFPLCRMWLYISTLLIYYTYQVCARTLAATCIRLICFSSSFLLFLWCMADIHALICKTIFFRLTIAVIGIFCTTVLSRVRLHRPCERLVHKLWSPVLNSNTKCWTQPSCSFYCRMLRHRILPIAAEYRVPFALTIIMNGVNITYFFLWRRRMS